MTLTSISGLVPGAAKRAFNVGIKASATTSWLALKNNNLHVQFQFKLHLLYSDYVCQTELLNTVMHESVEWCAELLTKRDMVADWLEHAIVALVPQIY